MDTKFFRDKHNIEYFSGTAKNTLSLFSEENALSASGYLSASGTVMLQLDGRPPGLYGVVPGVYGEIIPSGGTSATGSSNHWFMPQVYTESVHILAYTPEIASNLLTSGWIPSAR